MWFGGQKGTGDKLSVWLCAYTDAFLEDRKDVTYKIEVTSLAKPMSASMSEGSTLSADI